LPESRDRTSPPPAREDTGATADDLHLRVCYSDLRRALEEEKTLLGGKYERYLAENIPSDAALQDEALMPSEKDGQAMARQADQIEKQIEAKTRLLLFTQSVRRSAEPAQERPYKGKGAKRVCVVESTK
jgi:hypothetical protein